MKRIDLQRTDLDACVKDAQHEQIILTRDGKPVAVVVGVEDIDEEELQLGSSDKFWKLISQRRTEKTMRRAQLEQKVKER
jgi:prevent-host-death family protein